MPRRKVTGTVTFSDGVSAKVQLVIDIDIEVRRAGFTFIAGTIIQADPDGVPPHQIAGRRVSLTNRTIYTGPINATFVPDEPSP